MRASSVPPPLNAILRPMRPLLAALPAIPALLVLVMLVCRPVAAEPAKGTQPAPPPPASVPDSDAAARHAKRTVCLKEAKSRKLLGAQKSAFLKECFAAP